MGCREMGTPTHCWWTGKIDLPGCRQCGTCHQNYKHILRSGLLTTCGMTDIQGYPQQVKKHKNKQTNKTKAAAEATYGRKREL